MITRFKKCLVASGLKDGDDSMVYTQRVYNHYESTGLSSDILYSVQQSLPFYEAVRCFMEIWMEKDGATKAVHVPVEVFPFHNLRKMIEQYNNRKTTQEEWMDFLLEMWTGHLQCLVEDGWAIKSVNSNCLFKQELKVTVEREQGELLTFKRAYYGTIDEFGAYGMIVAMGDIKSLSCILPAWDSIIRKEILRKYQDEGRIVFWQFPDINESAFEASYCLSKSGITLPLDWKLNK